MEFLSLIQMVARLLQGFQVSCASHLLKNLNWLSRTCAVKMILTRKRWTSCHADE